MIFSAYTFNTITNTDNPNEGRGKINNNFGQFSSITINFGSENLSGTNVTVENITGTNSTPITIDGLGSDVIIQSLANIDLISSSYLLLQANGSEYASIGTTNLTASRTFEFPDIGGTLALSTDLSSYLPLIGGNLTGALNILNDSQLKLSSSTPDTIMTLGPSYMSLHTPTNWLDFTGNYMQFYDVSANNAIILQAYGAAHRFDSYQGSGNRHYYLQFPTLGTYATNYTVNLPLNSGTLALTSDIAGYTVASNGLTRTGNVVGLGGSLTGNTSISGSGTYNLSLGTNSSKLNDLLAYAYDAVNLKVNGGSGTNELYVDATLAALYHTNGSTASNVECNDTRSYLNWENSSAAGIVSINLSGVGISTLLGNTYYAYLRNSNFTSDRSFEFPDNSGTLALLSDISGFTGDAWGLSGNSISGGEVIGSVSGGDWGMINDGNQVITVKSYGPLLTGPVSQPNSGSFRYVTTDGRLLLCPDNGSTSGGAFFGVYGMSGGTILGSSYLDNSVNVRISVTSIAGVADALHIDRTGQMLLGNGLFVSPDARLDIKSFGYTSGTTALNVANLVGTQLLKLDDTGNLKIGSEILDTSDVSSILPNSRILKDSASYQSVDWQNRYLKFPSSFYTSIDWGNGILFDSSNFYSIQWTARVLNDTINNTSLDWGNRQLRDSAGQITTDWQNRQLFNSTGTGVTVDWQNARYNDSLGNPMFRDYKAYASTGENTADFENGILKDYTGDISVSWAENGNEKQLQHNGFLSVDWKNRTLNDSNGTGTSIDWQNRYLKDSLGEGSILWEQRILSLGGGNYSLDWSNRKLYDSTGNVTSIDWQNRLLVNISGNSTLSWQNSLLYDNNTSLASIDWQNRNLWSDGYKEVLNWNNGKLYDLNTNQSSDWINRKLYDSTGSGTSIDWQNRILYYANGSPFANFDSLGRIYNDANNVALDAQNFYLYSPDGAVSVDFQNRILTTSSNAGSIDWQSRKLYDSTGTGTSIDWTNRKFYNSGNNEVANWNASTLYSVSGPTASINWENRIAFDSSGNNSIDWTSRVLRDTTGGSTTVDWANRRLYGTSFISLDWGNYTLNDAAGIKGVDWGSRLFYDNNIIPSLDFQNRTLKISGLTSLDWTNRSLYDSSGSTSLDWSNRNLVGSWSSSTLSAASLNVSSLKLKNLVTSASTLTLDTSATNYIFYGSSSTVWTLPAITGNIDLTFFVKNRSSSTITLQRSGSDSLYTTAPVNSVTINPGESYMISNDGFYWNLM